MRFKDICLREVGHFTSQVAVTGITPGLNDLSAPNEAGKSTVFRAVDVLFREKHTSSKTHSAKLGQSPGIHDRNAVGSFGDDAQIMGNQHHGSAPLATQPFKQRYDLRLHRYVQSCRRFVSDHKRWLGT